jgi:uncharacterized protein with HEPN domain
MQKDNFILLRHMLDAAREAVSFAANNTRHSLNTDSKLELALIKCIEIVGEAASKVSIDYRENTSQVPWTNIISMRNRLIHGYFDIDLDILWQTVVEDLPPLIAELEKIIEV